MQLVEHIAIRASSRSRGCWWIFGFEITNNQVVTTVNRGKNTHQEYLSFNFFSCIKIKKKKVGFFFSTISSWWGSKVKRFWSTHTFWGHNCEFEQIFLFMDQCASICECGVKKRYVNFDFETVFWSLQHWEF